MKTHTKLRTIGRACLALFGLTLLAGIASAQTSPAGAIEGRVLNAATGQYLKNATVELVGTGRSTTSEDAGVFVFPNVPAGTAKVRVTYTGLDAIEQSVTVPASGTARAEFAMKSAEYDNNVLKLEGFVVAATREGNAKAIVQQRNALNVQTVIASDAFGSVSEDNVGEFLKYMSGLSIDYVENDARQVRVRGMSAKYASVTIDGNPVASADFGIATGRSFQFEQVSLSTVDTIELNKTPLADQSADSLAGSINVKSKSALNQKGRRIRYSASLTANEFATSLSKTMGWDNREHNKVLPNGSLEFSDTLLNGRLGVVAAVNHTGTYVEQKIIANLGRTFDTNPNNNDTEIPAITQINWQDGLKPTFRDSVLINLDYKATPDMIVSLRTSYNYYDAPFHNRNWTFGANTTTTGLPQQNLTYRGVTTTATSAADTANSVTIAGTNFRKYGATFNVNPAFNWKINENTTFDASVSYSRSYQWYDSDAEGYFNIVNARMNGVSWEYTSDEGEPNLQLRQLGGATSNPGSFFNLANYNSNNTAQTAHRDSKDQYYSGRADVTMKLPRFPMPATIKFGVDSRMLVKDIETWTKVWSMNVNPAGGIPLALYPDPYIVRPHKGETITDLTGAISAPPSLDKWRLYDLFKTYNTDPLTVTTAAQQPFFLTEAQVGTNLRNKLQNMFDLKETIQSAYVLGNVKVRKDIQVVAGLRFETTETQGRAFDDLGHIKASAMVGQTGTTGATYTNSRGYIIARYGGRGTKENSYDDLFPSMQLRYTPRQNVVVRGAYYKSILRPDTQNTARGLVINDTETVFTTANPDLKPEYADNFEARVEYYFEPVGLISGGIFYKKLKDVQVTLQTIFDNTNVPEDVLAAGYTAADLIARSAQYNRTVNGPDTDVWGYELDYNQQLSFLPGHLKGFGVFANYTYTNPEEEFFFTGGSGVPKHAVNAGVTYKAQRFSGQIKFNWLGKRILATPGYSINPFTGQVVLGTVNATTGVQNPNAANSGRIDYEKERLQIDINLDYQLHRRATVFLNIANATGAESIRYAVKEANLIRHGGFGAKYTLGVKGSF